MMAIHKQRGMAWAAVAAAVLLLACLSPTTADVVGDDCAVSVDYNPSINYFPQSAQLVTDVDAADATEVMFSEDFSVRYFNAYKVVSNLRSGEDFVLYQCGTPKPNLEVSNTTKFHQVPVRSVATGLSAGVGFIEALGVTQQMSYASMTYFTSPCLKKREQDCKDLEHFPLRWGNDSDQASWTAKAEEMGGIVLTDSWNTAASKTEADVKFDTSSDPGILKRAEWIKFLALFFNKEAEANKFFKGIQDKIEAMTSKATIGQTGAKPSMAWINHRDGYDPKGYFISDAGYKTEYTTFAGGVVHGANADDASDAVQYALNDAGPADFKEALKGAYMVVDEGYYGGSAPNRTKFMDKYGFTDADITSGDYPFLSDERVFTHDKRVAQDDYSANYSPNDWLESSIANPDLVLQDFAYVLQPDVFPEYSETMYLRNVMKNEEQTIISAVDCTKTCDAMAVPVKSAAMPPPASTMPPPPSSASGVSLGLAAVLSLLVGVFA